MMMQGDLYCHCQLSDVHQRAAMQQLRAKVFKLSFEYLNIYSHKSGDFAKNSKNAPLVSCQRFDL